MIFIKTSPISTFAKYPFATIATIYLISPTCKDDCKYTAFCWIMGAKTCTKFFEEMVQV
jgi:hypothetical protein